MLSLPLPDRAEGTRAAPRCRAQAEERRFVPQRGHQTPPPRIKITPRDGRERVSVLSHAGRGFAGQDKGCQTRLDPGAPPEAVTTAAATYGGGFPPASKMAAPRLSEMASQEEACGLAHSQNGRRGYSTSWLTGRSERGVTAWRGLAPRAPRPPPPLPARCHERGGGGRAEAALRGMEPAGAPPQGCAPAQEAEEPPGSPALPAEEPQGGQTAGVPTGDGALPGAADREREPGRRGAGLQGPPGRAVRGRGRRAPGRRGGEETGRTARRPRVTVDSSKAKTSLEALKISLRQLRWREVRPADPGPSSPALERLRRGPPSPFCRFPAPAGCRLSLAMAPALALPSAACAALLAVLGKPPLRCLGICLWHTLFSSSSSPYFFFSSSSSPVSSN